ncbi:MAG: AraC family transcriptional regulator [Pseudomonadota bacterium]
MYVDRHLADAADPSVPRGVDLDALLRAPRADFGDVMFDSSRFSPRDAIEASRAVHLGQALHTPLSGASDRLVQSIRAARVGPAVATRMVQGPSRVDTYRGWFSNERGRVLVARILIRGRFLVMKDDEIHDARPGYVHLSDCFSGVFAEDAEALSLALPAEELGLDRIEPVYRALPLSSPLGRQLGRSLSDVFAEPSPPTAGSDAPGLGSLRTLLRAALGLEDPARAAEISASGRRARLIRDHVAAHALGEDMAVDEICAATNASRATVYRAFAADGGLRSFLKRERLRHAALALSEAPQLRGVVRQIGEASGFEDPSAFNRVFRHAYGFPPGAIVSLYRGLRHGPSLADHSDPASRGDRAVGAIHDLFSPVAPAPEAPPDPFRRLA